jgi:hypothetical protein
MLTDKWSEEELDVIRELYPKLHKHPNPSAVWDQILSRLPGRSKFACQVRANRIGVVAKRPWSPEEDEKLRQRWPDCSASTILQHLPGRSWNAVRLRAKKLRIEGRWQGYVTMREAAEKIGYSTTTMYKIMAQMGVSAQVRAPRGKPRGAHRVVELDVLIEAVEKYHEMETPRQAARRCGLNGQLVARWVKEAGLRAPRPGSPMLLMPATLDRIIRERLKTWKPRPRKNHNGQ